MSEDERDTGQIAVALEHMTGPSRGALTWLGASTLDVTLDAGCFIQISEAQTGTTREDLVARLHRVDDTYEVEAKDSLSVWVNGERVTSARLNHGDTIEFGETGPLCRTRFYTEHSPIRNSVYDIVSDIWTYLRVSRQPPLQRFFRACSALFGRLTKETSILFRVTVLAALAGLGWFTYQQWKVSTTIQESVARNAAQLDTVAADIVVAQRDALRPSDLADLRESLEQRVTSNVTRLEELELRSTASSRVIAQSGASVAFLQGVYGYRERDGSRMLRQVVNTAGVPMITPRGRPLLSLDGDGPVVELQFTGTGFLVGEAGLLVTNRHVALPWEQSGAGEVPLIEGVEPVMIRLLGYLPGEMIAVPLVLVRASESADLALLRPQDAGPDRVGLRLAQQHPASGDEVIVMGYPTGLRSMLAQSGPEFIRELQETENTGFWSVAERLAEKGYIAPLSSRGIVGQVSPNTIVYDAETTHGGSGGPVLDINGEVVAVNAAILPEYGGSNLGVPISEVRALLQAATSQ